MKRSRQLIEVEAIIVAYAMSRLDRGFLQRFKFGTWQEAFRESGKLLSVPPASMKNLRDEFDPIHPNNRMGWHKRPLRPNRQRVLGEFCDASDEAITEVVERVFRHDQEVRKDITEPMATIRNRVENVAERLRTGRLAEEYFISNSERICGVPAESLMDCRFEARGFDFGVKNNHKIAIEVKGLKLLRGDIVFTDCEWHQAIRRQVDFWLVVVGHVDRKPQATMIPDPSAVIKASSVIRHSAVVSWRAKVAID